MEPIDSLRAGCMGRDALILNRVLVFLSLHAMYVRHSSDSIVLVTSRKISVHYFPNFAALDSRSCRSWRGINAHPIP